MNSRRYSKFLAGLVTSLILLSLLINSAKAAAGVTTRVSVASDGTQGNSNSYDTNIMYTPPSISADGRYVAFNSLASNLVSGDTNGYNDIFVHDQQTGQTMRVSVASDGTQGNNNSGSGEEPSISADGRYVAFTSYASNLVSGDTNSYDDIFVHDLQTGETTRVSVASDGTQGNDGSQYPSISANGRYVAFGSMARNLVNGDTTWSWDVFVHDRQTGETTRVSVASDGTQSNGESYFPSISADGHYVAFMSYASNLVSGDTNGTYDVFVHDQQTGETTRVSVDSNGKQGNWHSEAPSFSADGRYVAFMSNASNLVSEDMNGTFDIFVHDQQTGETTRVSVASDNTQSNGDSYFPSISADGRYMAFSSTAYNLVSGDTNGASDVFVHDRQTGQTLLASEASDDSQGNDESIHPSISADGRYVVFASNATNLVSGDTNGYSDVFVHENDVPVGPFLDLPVQYTNFSVAANGNYGGSNTGLVNSWFDHNVAGQTVTTWTGNTYTGAAATSPDKCNRESCYDGHNGIDFRNTQSNELVYAAANGTVFGVVNNCQNSSGGCTGYGNRVWIDHHNGYATLYGHLSTVSVTNGTEITDRLAQPIGVMGSTGNSTGIHLHFGLYYDQNGQWSENEAGDPYGYQGANYLWIHPLSAQQQIDSSGGNSSAPSGNLVVTVPAGAVTSPVTLELWDTPPVAGASAGLRSTGNSFWMRVLEWLTGGSGSSLMASASTNSFDVPVTVTVHYDPSWMPHLDTDQLIIYQWDDVSQAWVALLPTTLDAVNQQATAYTSQPGYFDLQAPLVCPADTLEPNDNYDGASIVQTDGTLVSNLFDIAQDEDWFKFDATTGSEYVIQTTNLATGVDTVLEIYDTDGVTLLLSDDNGGGENASSLTWQAPQNSLYFLRVSRAIGSGYGCNATYQFKVMQMQRLFLPLIVR